MKTMTIISIAFSAATLLAVPLRAEEPKKKEEVSCMKSGEDKMKAEAAEIDKLVDEMNASTGGKKIEAMAAIINKLVQKHKEMHAKMGGMMMGMMKKDGKPEGKSGEADYYTCAMHPAVHWPIPGKCPICSMDLVPVSKKPSDTKADDPHAGHH
jgi:hypothetical protein